MYLSLNVRLVGAFWADKQKYFHSECLNPEYTIYLGESGEEQ